jgi:acetyl esterase/lipase
MGILHRLDPAFAAVVRERVGIDAHDIATAREIHISRLPPVPAPVPSVVRRDLRALDDRRELEVPIRVFTPVGLEGWAPCMYWIPGGGHILVSPGFDEAFCEEIAMRHRCVVVAVRWRPAPEDPFPAAIEDCYAGLAWTFDSAEELGIDVGRVMVAGRSSGGGSAAGLGLLVRDRGELSIVHQMLIYPMLDDTGTTESSQIVTETQLWNRETNELAWRAYLGDDFGTQRVSPYAAPSRMVDLRGVAPASILVGELDLFRDEGITYAQRLMQAEVPTELHVYPGAPHGFESMAPDSSIARGFVADRDAILSRAFRGASS